MKLLRAFGVCVLLVAFGGRTHGEAKNGTEKDVLVLCVGAFDAETLAPFALTPWIKTTKVTTLRGPAEGPCQVPAEHRYVAFFVTTGARVELVLLTPWQLRLSRHVPWLADTRAPLVTLGKIGRLSGFGVLVEGLLAEARVTSSPKREALSVSAAGSGKVESGGGAPLAAKLALETTRPSETPGRDRPEQRLEGHMLAHARWRPQALVAPETALGVRWRSLFGRLRLQFPADFKVSDRVLSWTALAFEAGFSPLLMRHPSGFAWRGAFGIMIERSMVSRIGVPASRTHSATGIGGVVGTNGSWPLGEKTRLGLHLEGIYLPAVEEIRIFLGPTDRPSGISLGGGLFFSYGQ